MSNSSPVIYEPQGRAGEYASLACNIFNGCEHACWYCFGHRTMKKDKEAFKIPGVRPNILARLEHDAMKMQNDPRHVLLCFVTDPYQPFDEKTAITRQSIEILQRYNMRVTILTKGGLRALRDFDLLHSYKSTRADQFAATLTYCHLRDSLNNEPLAASPAERLESLRQAHERGLYTWASLEPVCDPDQTIELIHISHTFVDEFRVGRLNYEKTDINWKTFGQRVIKTFQLHGCHYYIKNDLMLFMPEGIRQRR